MRLLRLSLCLFLLLPVVGCRQPEKKVEEERLARADRVIRHWERIALDGHFVGFQKTEEAMLDEGLYHIFWIYDEDVKLRGYYTESGRTFAFRRKLGERVEVSLGRQEPNKAIAAILELPEEGNLLVLDFYDPQELEGYPIEQPWTRSKKELKAGGEE